MRPKKLVKIDFRKSLKQLYTASRGIEEVKVPPGAFLMIDGRGKPGDETFQAAIGKLYSVAYTLKFMLKAQGVLDFGVPCVECLYTTSDSCRTPMSDWTWRLLVRIPEAVTAAQLAAARAEVRKRRQIDAAGVQRRSFSEGRCLQILHVGPYGEVGPVYEKLLAHAAETGLAQAGSAHEVYISDPRRVPPPKLKTVVRIPVKRRKGASIR